MPFLREAEKLADSLPEESRSAVRLRLAEQLLERENLAEAETLFRAELLLHPDSERVALGLGQIALARGDNQTAVRLLTPLAQKSPYARKHATVQLARLSRRDHDEAALRNYEQKLASMPADLGWPDPFYATMLEYQVGELKTKQIIRQLEERGEYRAAAEIYLAQIKGGRPTSAAYLGAGICLVRAGDYEQGLPLLRLAQQLDPNAPSPPLRLADALFQRAVAERGKVRDSPDARAWLREAIKSARRAAELEPNTPDAYLIQGVALLLLGEPRAAVEPLRRGVEYRPEGFKLQYALGMALLESARCYRPHDFQEAAIHLENARRLDPTGEGLKRLRAILAP